MPIIQKYLTKPYNSIENLTYHQMQQSQKDLFFEHSQQQQKHQSISQAHLNSQMYHQSPQYFQNNYYQNNLQNHYQMQKNQKYLNQMINNNNNNVTDKFNSTINTMQHSTLPNAYQNDPLNNYTTIPSVLVSTTLSLPTTSGGLPSSFSSTSSQHGSNNSFEQVSLNN